MSPLDRCAPYSHFLLSDVVRVTRSLLQFSLTNQSSEKALLHIQSSNKTNATFIGEKKRNSPRRSLRSGRRRRAGPTAVPRKKNIDKN